MLKFGFTILIQASFALFFVMGLIFSLGGYANNPSMKSPQFLDYYFWLALISIFSTHLYTTYNLWQLIKADGNNFWLWAFSPIITYIILIIMFVITIKIAK